jgi:hypothetical protein
MLRKLLTFAVIAASAPSPIHAQRKISLVSGNTLYDWCNDPGSVEFCTAYVMGAVDAIDTQQFAGAKIDKIPPVICVPEKRHIPPAGGRDEQTPPRSPCAAGILCRE